MRDRAVDITDFEHSCVRWRIDTTRKPVTTVSRELPMTLNNVRALLEARAIITRQDTGRVFDYVLTASCKTEQVWVPRDIWHEPNADMCMIAGADEFLIVKRWDRADKGVMRYPESLGVQPERQPDKPQTSFDRYSVDLLDRQGTLLQTVDEIIEVLFDTTPVVAQTEYEASGYHVLLQYPVKTVNFSEREGYYQVDTGPVLFPDFDTDAPSVLERCQLAYIAHNCPDWAELIVCAPTALTDEIRVHHHSRSVRIEGASNRMIAVC